MELFPLDERGQRLLAADLNWVLGNGLKVADLADENKARVFVRQARDASEVVGFAATIPKKTSVFSLAALCAVDAVRANTPLSAYLLHLGKGSDGTDAYALCGVASGIPAIGYDRVRPSLKDILGLMTKFRQAVEPDHVVVRTNILEILQRGDSMEIALPGLLNLLHQKDIAASARLTPVPGNHLFPMAMGAIVVTAGVWFGWQFWQEHEAQERMRRAAANRKPPQQVYEASLPGAYSKAGWSLADAHRVLGQIASTPLDRGGWRAEKVVCNIGSDGCIFSWVKALPSGTIATFVTASGVGADRLTIAPDRISETAPVKVGAYPAIPTNSLRPPMAFLTGIVSELQRLAGTGDMQISLRDPLPFATSDTSIRPVLQGGITASGDLYLLPLVLAIESRHVSVSSIEISFGAKPSFKAELNYYARKP